LSGGIAGLWSSDNFATQEEQQGRAKPQARQEATGCYVIVVSSFWIILSVGFYGTEMDVSRQLKREKY
jgi:hypothetical protein